jgi:hypothetical protein
MLQHENAPLHVNFCMMSCKEIIQNNNICISLVHVLVLAAHADLTSIQVKPTIWNKNKNCYCVPIICYVLLVNFYMQRLHFGWTDSSIASIIEQNNNTSSIICVLLLLVAG